MNKVAPDQVEKVRDFNRFYTYLTGALDEHYLSSQWNLAEARVLYDISARPDVTAKDLATSLRLDPGFLSRILRRHSASGLVRKSSSKDDRRRHPLTLTPQGRRAVESLNKGAQSTVKDLIAPLSPDQRESLLRAMNTIRAILQPAPLQYRLRAHQIGDMGWIVEQKAKYYSLTHGWNNRIEANIARICAEFLDNFDPARERCWIAEDVASGERLGSVFLVANEKRPRTIAQLRLLYVSPTARGLGLGKRLVRECTHFAAQAGYRQIKLWTHSVLEAAVGIYRQEGYTLESDEVHSRFGPLLTSQIWTLNLKEDGRSSGPKPVNKAG